MFKIVTIIGARPQIIKAAALSRAIAGSFSDKITEVIVHTGQHYDGQMSAVFFSELGIPEPDYNLDTRSGMHGAQTARMIEGIEEILIKEKPQCVVVYGDTNSTLAAAIAASKMHIPIAHVEAGLRSYNKKMPEEVNRILCDHVSTLLFSPTKAGLENLMKEGFSKNEPPYSMDNPGIYHCGDVMYDNSLHFSGLSDERSTILGDLALSDNEYVLATVHRNSNTDEAANLTAIIETFLTISEKLPVVFPVHPRTTKMMQQLLPEELLERVKSNSGIRLIDPVSFLDMIALEKHSKMVITDSGGVQKEAFYFKKPCIILRPQTEWVELVENGNAIVTNCDSTKIREAFDHFYNNQSLTYPPIYGDGHAAEFICGELLKQLA